MLWGASEPLAIPTGGRRRKGRGEEGKEGGKGGEEGRREGRETGREKRRDRYGTRMRDKTSTMCHVGILQP